MVRKNGETDDRHIKWAEPIRYRYTHVQKRRNDRIYPRQLSIQRPPTCGSCIGQLNGVQKWQNDDRHIEWCVKWRNDLLNGVTESIDHPRQRNR